MIKIIILQFYYYFFDIVSFFFFLFWIWVKMGLCFFCNKQLIDLKEIFGIFFLKFDYLKYFRYIKLNYLGYVMKYVYILISNYLYLL